MKAIFLALAIATLGLSAHAQESAEQNMLTIPHKTQARWACAIAFEGEAQGLQVIVGRFESAATGEIRCKSSSGDVYRQPVRVSMRTTFLSPTVGVGKFHFVGRAAKIAISHSSPEVLFGKYVVAQGQAAVVGGAGAFVATHTQIPNLALQVSLQLEVGLGVELGFTRMWIEPIN